MKIIEDTITTTIQKHFQEQITALQSQLDTMTKAKPKGRYKPEIGEGFHRVAFTDKGIHWFKYSGDEAGRSLYTMGNCYRTKEEAEAARDKQIATVRVLDRVAELNEGWVPDWSDDHQYKNHSYYSHRRRALDVAADETTQSHLFEYYAKAGVWEQVISEMESDVLLMLGVEL